MAKEIIMNKQDYIELMNSLHPDFFKREDIRNIPDEWICDEMLLLLDEFELSTYEKELDDNITFGYYAGTLEEIRENAKRVVPGWETYFSGKERVYCGYVDGKVASFCQIEDMGIYTINGSSLKIGGPGCVGTLPEYRNKGIGLTMVKNVTGILKEEGYDCSYIHYTGEAKWYEKLGYKRIIRWNKYGVI